ncbi:MAG: hypothetical protein ACPL4C_00750, partial [Brevinematia bacterium]
SKISVVFLIFLYSTNLFSFELSKPDIFIDENRNSILVMLLVEGDLPQNLENLLVRNIDLNVIFNVRLIRKDFGILNVQTEITNILVSYKVYYDLLFKRIVVYNDGYFKVIDKLSSLPVVISPLLFKIKLDELKNNPDFYEVYQDTKFFISVQASIVYMKLKPPLSLIASVLGMGNIETPVVYSEEFKLR